jgi:hypothetical protein
MSLLKSGSEKFNEVGAGVGRPKIFYSEDWNEQREFALTGRGRRLLKFFLESDHLRSGQSDIPANQGIVIRRDLDRDDRFVIEQGSQTRVVTLAELGSFLLSPIFDYLETVHDPVTSQR